MSETLNYLLRIGKSHEHELTQHERQEYASYLNVELAGENYYIEITKVREVSNALEVFALGHTQRWFKGIMKFQGDIFSVVDLGYFLTDEVTKEKQRSAVALSQDIGSYALLVNQIKGIIRFRSLKEKAQHKDGLLTVYADENLNEVNVLNLNVLASSEEFLNPALFK